MLLRLRGVWTAMAGGGGGGGGRRGREENSLCLDENISFHQQHISVQPHFFFFQCSFFCWASAMDFSGGELRRQLFSVSLRHGQPHSIFRGWASVHGIFICPNSAMATSTRQFVTPTQMFMHAMARRGSRHNVRECELKVAAAESANGSCRHTVWKSVHWKLVLAARSLPHQQSQICISSTPDPEHHSVECPPVMGIT